MANNKQLNCDVEDNENEVAIILTDIQFHATTPRKPKTITDGVRKMLRSGKSWRTYASAPTDRSQLEPGTFKLELPLAGLESVIADAQAKGKRIRFFIPKAGIPVTLGKDGVQKLASLKRQGQM